MEGSPASPARSSPVSTPRVSHDVQACSSSPRFPALHRRLRTPSNASSVASGTLPAADTVKSGKSEALRSAKRFLLSTVRNDWAYPPDGFSDLLDGVHLELRDPIDYRCRIDGSSDYDSDGIPLKKGPAAHAQREENDPYKFDSPDAVATSMLGRKSRKRKLIEEEMGWNDGLRTFAQRRDAWTAATDRPPGRRKSRAKGHGLDAVHDRNDSASTAGSVEWPLSSGSPKPSSATTSSSTDSVDPTSADIGPWLPVFPPLLPEENPVRANIKPAAYPTIYSKVVIQSLTPTVPIPLTHMTYAIVEGWKLDGAWPPQGGPAPPIINEGRKATSLLKFRKARAQSGEKGRMRKSIGLVKKVLGVEDSRDDEPCVDLDVEEQQDAEAEETTELN